MPDNVTLNVDWSEVQSYLKDISDKSLGLEGIADGFRAGGLVLLIFMTENLSGRLLNVDTGTLRRSIFVDDPVIESGGVVMSYGSRGVPYAAIHEFGGTITYLSGRTATFRERRMFRDAAERSMPGIVQQVGLQLIKRLREAGKR